MIVERLFVEIPRMLKVIVHFGFVKKEIIK